MTEEVDTTDGLSGGSERRSRIGGRGSGASEEELRERIKELTCLYEVAAAFAEDRGSMRSCFGRIATILPQSLRFTEEAEARIRLDDLEECTPRFSEANESLSHSIKVGGRPRGEVTVAYRAHGGRVGRGDAFVVEERSLLRTVANQIGIFVERFEAEEQRKRAELQLRHADRLASIGQLAAGVAHELNEPLSNIMGFAQLAQKAEDLPEAARLDLEKIVKATLHGREIIRKLLVFARQAPAAKAPVDLNMVVEDALFLLEAGCEHPGIRFRRELADDLPKLEADPVQVRQIVVNLVINAIHAIKGAGVITIRTQGAESAVELVVEDTGGGMMAEVAARIFDPFFTTKDVGEGTGLGLSVVEGIVTGHGGTIEVETSPGSGSRFRVRLPAVQAGA